MQWLREGKKSFQELHNAPEAFSNAMAEQLEPSLISLNNAIEELRQQREESSTDAIQRLVEEFRESLSGSATAQLEGLAETVSQCKRGFNNFTRAVDKHDDKCTGAD